MENRKKWKYIDKFITRKQYRKVEPWEHQQSSSDYPSVNRCHETNITFCLCSYLL